MSSPILPKGNQNNASRLVKFRLSKSGWLMLVIFILTGLLLLQTVVEFFPSPTLLADSSKGSVLQTHYLIDLEYSVDEKNGFGRIPHLSVFNPGLRDAQLKVTVFYEDREPTAFQLVAPAQTSFENDARAWQIPINTRFGLKIESTEPVVTQATQGWNNTRNDYSLNSSTNSANGPRETAKSYMSLNSLGQECYIADGIVINAPEETWIKETEDLIVLNPNKRELTVTIYIYYGERKVTRLAVPLDVPVLKRQVQILAERMAVIPLTGWVKSNWHYGTRITGDQPFAAQWLRMVYWYDSPELMSEWSVPCVSVK